MLFTKPYLLHVLNMLEESSVCEFLVIRSDANFLARDPHTRTTTEEIRSCFILTSQVLKPL